MQATYFPTTRLFRPTKGSLSRFVPGEPEPRIVNKSDRFAVELKDLISKKDYPCVAALRSYHKDDYQVGVYGKFGSGESWRDLRNDLLFFLEQQRKTSSIYLSFFAVFDDQEMSEEDFEAGLWKELSMLTSEEDRATDWSRAETANPDDAAFRFSLGGAEFFVVGLHSQSSRLSRRMSCPVLIFNVFDQFNQLMKLGQYDAMVASNRQRDTRFQGDVNPMVAAHGETWESIQFSGRNNGKNWKCPFHWFKRAQKP
jgi:FPC/CPF motif-containing protein YcgG